MTRSPAILFVAAFVAACDEGRPWEPPEEEREGITYDTGGVGAGDQVPSPSAGPATTGYTPVCFDCPIYEGTCTNEDGTVRCGAADNPLCPGCPYSCTCAGNEACVDAKCELRQCAGLNVSPYERCNTCLEQDCCDELDACAVDPAGCTDESGTIRDDTPPGRALLACQDLYCTPDCNSVCGTDLFFSDDRITACANERCCEDFFACVGEDDDLDGCLACLDSGGGPRCDAALACFEGCFPPDLVGPVCDSGAGAEMFVCLGDACCSEFRDCTLQGEDIEACATCLEADGGPLCDAALARAQGGRPG